MKIEKTYAELSQGYNLMKRERDVANEALRKCISDCRVNGFYNPTDAAEFGVRAQARIRVLEQALWDITERCLHPHVEYDQGELIKLLGDKGWMSAPIVEYTVKWGE